MSTETGQHAGGLEGLRRRVDELSPVQSFLLVLLFFLAVYIPTADYVDHPNIDPVAASLPAGQLAKHGNLTLDRFEGELCYQAPDAEPDDPPGACWIVPSGERFVSNRFAGVILAGVPFYLVTPVDVDVEDADDFPIWPGSLAAAVLTALAMAVLHLTFRKLVTPSRAVGAVVVAGLGTATWSVSADALWTHGPGQLWLAGAMLAAAAGSYAVTGVAYGLALLTRPQNAFIAAGHGIYDSWRRRRWRPAVMIGIFSGLGLVALLGWNAYVFEGAPSVEGGYSYGPGKVVGFGGSAVGEAWAFVTNVGGTFFDPKRGIFWYSPFLLALAPGLRHAWRAAPTWAKGASLGGILQMLVQFRLNRYDSTISFWSYRLPLEFLTMQAPLLLLAYREWTSETARRRFYFWALVAASVAAIGIGAALDLE